MTAKPTTNTKHRPNAKYGIVAQRLRALAATVAVASSLVMVAACGFKSGLHPSQNQSSPSIANGQEKPLSAEELTTPGAEERPGRSAELLSRSQEREPDEFDLPPG